MLWTVLAKYSWRGASSTQTLRVIIHRLLFALCSLGAWLHWRTSWWSCGEVWSLFNSLSFHFRIVHYSHTAFMFIYMAATAVYSCNFTLLLKLIAIGQVRNPPTFTQQQILVYFSFIVLSFVDYSDFTGSFKI